MFKNKVPSLIKRDNNLLFGNKKKIQNQTQTETYSRYHREKRITEASLYECLSA